MPPAIPEKLMEVSALSDIMCRYCACKTSKQTHAQQDAACANQLSTNCS
jgi:hypothetical protein